MSATEKINSIKIKDFKNQIEFLFELNEADRKNRDMCVNHADKIPYIDRIEVREKEIKDLDYKLNKLQQTSKKKPIKVPVMIKTDTDTNKNSNSFNDLSRKKQKRRGLFFIITSFVCFIGSIIWIFVPNAEPFISAIAFFAATISGIFAYKNIKH